MLVIDCASSDGTLEAVRTAPFAQAVALEQNVGFGRAAAIKACGWRRRRWSR
jgi:hypothetical protein